LSQSDNIFELFFSILVSVRETCADWSQNYKPEEDPAMKGEKDPDPGLEVGILKRVARTFSCVCPCIVPVEHDAGFRIKIANRAVGMFLS